MSDEYRVLRAGDEIKRGDPVYSSNYGYIRYYMRENEDTYIATNEEGELLRVEEPVWVRVDKPEEEDVVYPDDAREMRKEKAAIYQKETEDWVYDNKTYDCDIYVTDIQGYVIHQKPYSRADRFVYRESLRGLPSFRWSNDDYSAKLIKDSM